MYFNPTLSAIAIPLNVRYARLGPKNGSRVTGQYLPWAKLPDWGTRLDPGLA